MDVPFTFSSEMIWLSICLFVRAGYSLHCTAVLEHMEMQKQMHSLCTPLFWDSNELIMDLKFISVWSKNIQLTKFVRLKSVFKGYCYHVLYGRSHSRSS